MWTCKDLAKITKTYRHVGLEPKERQMPTFPNRKSRNKQNVLKTTLMLGVQSWPQNSAHRLPTSAWPSIDRGRSFREPVLIEHKRDPSYLGGDRAS